MRGGLWVASLLTALQLAACAPSCTEACTNIAVACAPEFEAAKLRFDVEACSTDCDGNTERCQNIADQVACAAKAKSCPEVLACPCQK